MSLITAVLSLSCAFAGNGKVFMADESCSTAGVCRALADIIAKRCAQQMQNARKTERSQVLEAHEPVLAASRTGVIAKTTSNLIRLLSRLRQSWLFREALGTRSTAAA